MFKRYISAILVLCLALSPINADKGSSKPPPSKPAPASKYGSKPPSKSPSNDSKYGSKTHEPPSKPKTPSQPNEKAQANKQQASKRIYEEQHRATAPPKAEYKTPDGRTVRVNPNDKVVNDIRSKPSSYYQPEIRERRVVEHISVHYHHPYPYYCNQPVIYIGGGYSSPFWYMMLEWDAERRARWFYNNQARIEADAYNKGVRDAQVNAYISKWEAEKRARDANYVDSEFAKDPSLMYTQDHIEAIYNPTIKPMTAERAANVALLWIFVVFFGLVVLIFFICFLAVIFGRGNV